ncbi:MAG: hypothetical protein E7451_03665 [Ruminococcaceae bacterium]|nr:hypothetical protein [Oscillospiraceae bacterium]
MEKARAIAKRLLFLPGALAGLVGAAAFCALGWVFLKGYEAAWFAYPVYVLSFYALTVVCIHVVPKVIAWGKKPREERRFRFPPEKKKDLVLSLRMTLWINIGYALFHFLAGVWMRSNWMACNGGYYLVNAVIMGVLVGYERKIAVIDNDYRRLRTGWRVYELCGGLLLSLNLCMSVMVFQIIWQGQGEEYPGLLIFAVAAYTFYKLTIAVIRVVQCRKNRSPILGIARNMDLIEAMMSLFSLQTGLFAAFGQDFAHQTLMNCLTGGGVCALVLLGALGMMLHGRKRRNEIGRDAYAAE